MTFVQDAARHAVRRHSFTQFFAAACDKAGFPSACTFHGLRKAMLTRLADANARRTRSRPSAATRRCARLRVHAGADQVEVARAAMERDDGSRNRQLSS